MDLLDKDFKSPILDIFKEQKHTMSKELKIRMMPHEIETINREKLFLNDLIEILELRSTTEMKKFTRGVQ